MEKRFQVFISSTYLDLKNARQEVSQALLRAECFPAGMELFPAADQEQFEYIKSVIDQSDYYLLISAGRYGSTHPETGLSYTEMEYDYAVEQEKPIIRLLHEDPFNQLKGELIERSDKARKSLEDFRAKVSKGKMVSFWSTPKSLGAEVIFGLIEAQKRYPVPGWIKGENDPRIARILGGETHSDRLESLWRQNRKLNVAILNLASDQRMNDLFPSHLRMKPISLKAPNTLTFLEDPVISKTGIKLDHILFWIATSYQGEEGASPDPEISVRDFSDYVFDYFGLSNVLSAELLRMLRLDGFLEVYLSETTSDLGNWYELQEPLLKRMPEILAAYEVYQVRSSLLKQ